MTWEVPSHIGQLVVDGCVTVVASLSPAHSGMSAMVIIEIG
jgi:hypothetical protein